MREHQGFWLKTSQPWPAPKLARCLWPEQKQRPGLNSPQCPRPKMSKSSQPQQISLPMSPFLKSGRLWLSRPWCLLQEQLWLKPIRPLRQPPFPWISRILQAPQAQASSRAQGLQRPLNGHHARMGGPEEALQGSQFGFGNHNAKTTCGCGSSFSV